MIEIDGVKHTIGDKECSECWYEPRYCKCGGIIHSQYIDETWDDLYISHICDKCGIDYERIDD